jgi:hypothetical protein
MHSKFVETFEDATSASNQFECRRRKSMLCKLCYYTYNGFLSMVVLGLFLCGMATAQDHSAHTHAKPATLMQGYGDLHHPVSTDNPQAQQFFDQGLRQIYAFNHDEAARSFQRAADLDRKLAMAYWGSGRGCRTQLQRSRQRRPLRSGPYIHTEGR